MAMRTKATPSTQIVLEKENEVFFILLLQWIQLNNLAA